MRWVRFNTLLSWLERLAGTGRRRRETDLGPERAAQIVEAAAARSVGQTCLTRALVLRLLLARRGVAAVLLLARRGVAADLLLSVRRSGHRFGAHASVRVGDRTLLADDVHDSKPLWRHGFVPRRGGP